MEQLMNNTQSQIELLSRILSTEPSHLQTNALSQGIRESIDEIEETLQHLSISGKFEFLSQLKIHSNVLDGLLRHPVFIGKSRVGFLYDSMRARTEFYKEVFGTFRFQPILMKNNDIPIIHSFHPEDRITVANLFQHEELVESNELYTIIREFVSNHQMDLKETLNHVLIESNLPYENIMFTDINLSAGGNGNERQLKDNDFLIVNLHYTKNWSQLLLYLSKIGYDKKVIIIVKEKSDHLHQLLKDLSLDVTVYVDREFVKVRTLLKKWDKPIHNVFVKDDYERTILSLFVRIQEREEQISIMMETINKSILLSEKGEVEFLHELRAHIQTDMNQLNTAKENITRIWNRLVQDLQVVEDLLGEHYLESQTSSLAEDSLFHKHQMEGKYRLAELLIRTGEYERAKALVQELYSNDYSKAHILLVFLQQKRGLKPLKHSIEKIASLPNIDADVIEAKIKLKDDLALSRVQLINLSNKLKKTHLPEALYYKGIYYEASNVELAIECYKKAFLGGFKEAGDRLFKLWKKKHLLNMDGLTYLGNLLHPEANFLLAQRLKAVKNIASALVIGVIATATLPSTFNPSDMRSFRLVLASAAGHEQATVELAGLHMGNHDYEKAIEVCTFAIAEFHSSVLIQETLGVAYYESKQFAKAYEVLHQLNTGKACEKVGIMYEKGNGKVVNLDKALDYYKKGKDLNSNEAHTLYLKLSTRLEEEKKKKEESKAKSYNSNRSYSSSSSSSSSKSSSCFLTTATCKALGKEDNCKEIMAFKHFRDSWLIEQADGASIIKEYYKIAPDIVKNIEGNANYIQIYTYLWNTYIEKGYGYLMKKDFERAKETYIEMVLEVKEKY